MRILSIIHRYPPAIGGSETWAQEVCRGLVAKGHHVTVMTTSVNKEEEFWHEPHDADRTQVFGKYENDRGVHVFRYRRSLPLYSLYHIVFKHLLDWILGIYAYGPHSVELYGRLWGEVKRADILLVHTIPYPHNIVALLFARIHGKKIVIVPHFHPHHPAYERLSNFLLMRWCDAVIADTEFERDALVDRGVSVAHISTAGVGVHPDDYVRSDATAISADWRLEHGIGANLPVIAFLGRRMHEKGVDTLIEAVRILRKKRPIKLALAGPPSTWFDELYAQLAPGERADILDLGLVSHEEKVRLLHAVNLLALPSKHEAFGIVFLEAWMCGTPVIGTREGAIPEIVGEGGFLSGFGDAKDLAAVIDQALGDPNALSAAASAGKEKTLRLYTWETITDKVDAVLKSVQPRLKVLVVANAYPPNFIGGAELIAHYQACEVHRMGNDVAVFAGDPDKTSTRHRLFRSDFDGLPVWRVTLHPEDYSAEYFNFVHLDIERHFDTVLDAWAPDVVHIHNTSGLSTGLVGRAQRRNIKTVMTLHDHWGFCVKNTILKTATAVCSDFTACAECIAHVSDAGMNNIPIRLRSDYMAMQLERVDDFVTPSLYLAGAYKRAGFPAEKIRSIWYGIEIEKYGMVDKAPAPGVTRFTFVGYLGEHKGVNVLMDALTHLSNLLGSLKHVRLNIVGTGHCTPQIEQAIRTNGWQNVVHLWGRIDNRDIAEVYKETDVMILPSIWPENQPVTITEAMASGIPVIASRIGGIPEMIREGVDGFLFDAGDARGLADRMRKFVDAPEIAVRFGRSAADAMKENSFSVSARKLYQLYVEPRRYKISDGADVVIAVVGKSFSSQSLRLLQALDRKNFPDVRLVMANWLNETDIKRVNAFWIVDENTRDSDLIQSMAFTAPTLVPADEHVALQRLSDSTALAYASDEEFLACVKEFRQRDSGFGENVNILHHAQLY